MRNIRTSHLLVFPALFLLAVGYNNCGITRPSVEIASYASVGFKHSGLEAKCNACHETVRPAMTSAGVLHGNKADCVACHTPVNTRSGSVQEMWASNAGAYVHPSSGITTCLNCHDSNRPGPKNGYVHYNNNDCVMCHDPGTNNDTNGLTQAQIDAAFRSVFSWSHPVGQTNNCMSCHEKNRKDSTHFPGQDCVSCHNTNNTWNNTLTDAQIRDLWSDSVK